MRTRGSFDPFFSGMDIRGRGTYGVGAGQLFRDIDIFMDRGLAKAFATHCLFGSFFVS